ncbi:glutamyl-tRNA reductase [Clostridium tertium]|jgi:glutamyl-tRNA reductase|uniref:Glutamyl-tRNA reductase n=1 Tax=Clostridium tertium TaxID=1559 RepID=A0A9X3XP57_9CLOT|nr:MULTISPECIES: glutamyl-tRNA reductase [Clostridium]EEH98482.1 glutamyl-tRNA reductase [Clostridium sp. 7_2_43FAA]MDB1939518.1 glutamyl-tRNA reductase [Clostridium tertium]MDB1954253.1 glutamyl-tRNA reductase [Clostridium tertium]MDB1958992.1 glutamyl-tRNA reductase [Clostridium tertium]MDB1963144.1 glutamyl-tRNA reductase [Clostridium tertium]
MIQLLGIKKNTEVEIREKLSLSQKKREVYSKELIKYFDEVVILSTCNRTEIYFNGSLKGEEGLKKIFEVLNWDINLREYCFYLNEKETVRHLMEVVCGFHSKILGEDQILGQIKDAYHLADELGSVKHELQRLFQEAITCGKKFRTEGKLYEIPVSSASIAISEAIKNDSKRIMVIGYGEVGKLVVKYALSNDIKELNIVVRKVESVKDIEDKRVNIMNYEDGRNIINDMDCVVSCTSAPHLIIEKKHIKENGNKIIIFDLALPRDVDEKVKEYTRVNLYDIDDISSIDDDNKKLRKERMLKFKDIINAYIEEYFNWKDIRNIAPVIQDMKKNSSKVIKERQTTLKNKCNDKKDIEIAQKLIKSTSDYYVNRAIEVLKEEQLKGQGEKCIKILEKIFLKNV